MITAGTGRWTQVAIARALVETRYGRENNCRNRLRGVVKGLAAKLRATMPEESTIDLDRHADRIAQIVFYAKAAAVKEHAVAVRMWLADSRHESADITPRP